MLRVGLTGGLASGKSAVGLVFAEGGAHVLSADEIGRSLMEPGGPVYAEIVRVFGATVLTAEGRLDRGALGRAAFEQGRLPELNAIVHPAVLRAQEEKLKELAAAHPGGIAVVESALIFEVSRTAEAAGQPGWRSRFDKIVLVTAPEELKVARYVARVAPPGADQATRAALAADASRRLAAQLPDANKVPMADYILPNTRTLVLLRRAALEVLRALQEGAAAPR